MKVMEDKEQDTQLSTEEIREMGEMEEAMIAHCGCGRKSCPDCLATCEQ